MSETPLSAFHGGRAGPAANPHTTDAGPSAADLLQKQRVMKSALNVRLSREDAPPPDYRIVGMTYSARLMASASKVGGSFHWLICTLREVAGMVRAENRKIFNNRVTAASQRSLWWPFLALPRRSQLIAGAPAVSNRPSDWSAR
jgi:hypothetical protein